MCWGFAVLIPWGALQANLKGGLPLICCWGATVIWTFGFDTAYGMADQKDDKKLGINSSVLSFGYKRAIKIIGLSYIITLFLLAVGALSVQIGWTFWPLFLIATYAMKKEIALLQGPNNQVSNFGRHFRNQVWIGSLILLGLILGRI